LQGAIQTLGIARIVPEHNDDQKETNNAEHDTDCRISIS
jgi:hypothetical protein